MGQISRSAPTYNPLPPPTSNLLILLKPVTCKPFTIFAINCPLHSHFPSAHQGHRSKATIRNPKPLHLFVLNSTDPQAMRCVRRLRLHCTPDTTHVEGTHLTHFASTPLQSTAPTPSFHTHHASQHILAHPQSLLQPPQTNLSDHHVLHAVPVPPHPTA